MYNNSTSDTYDFIYSEFGCGGIQINASDEKYYASGSTGDKGYTCIRIYDGVLNDIFVNLSGFISGMKLTNLQCHIVHTGVYKYDICCISSCRNGLVPVQSEISHIFLINNCKVGFYSFQTIIREGSDGYKSVSTNNYHHGYSFWNNTTIHIGSDKTQSKILNSFWNDTGVQLWYNSTAAGVGWNLTHNATGYSINSNSRALFFGTSSVGTESSYISYNTGYGIFLGNSSSVELLYTRIYNNNSGINSEDSSINCSDDCQIHDNTGYGIFLKNSSAVLENVYIYTNNSDGINCQNSFFSIKNSYVYDNGVNGIYGFNSQVLLNHSSIYDNTSDGVKCDSNSFVYSNGSGIYNNSHHGISITNESRAMLWTTPIHDNGVYGLVSYRAGNVYYYSSDSNISINNNTNGDVLSGYNSCFVAYVKTAISNYTPNKNSNPSYSSASAGSYNLETVY
jgi:hypothetical protein